MVKRFLLGGSPSLDGGVIHKGSPEGIPIIRDCSIIQVNKWADFAMMLKHKDDVKG